MADSEIEWTDATWNPVVGCSRVSAGCQNCYAERVAHRGMAPQHKGLTRMSSRGPQWTGEVRFVAAKLAEPLSWRKPRRIFVNSMSDLFHEGLTNEQIAAVFGVMAACPQHTFQVLTKRPARMLEWFATAGVAERVDLFKHIALAGRIDEYFSPERIVEIDGWPDYFITSKGRVLSDKRGERRDLAPMAGEGGHSRVMLYRGDETARPLIHRLVLTAFDGAQPEDIQGCHVDGDATNNALWNLRWGTQSSNWADSKRHGTRRRYSKLTAEQVAELRVAHADGVSGAELGRRYGISDTQARNIATGKQWTPEPVPTWPLPAVWLGVSCENQAAADERIPLLLQTPAAVRFISAEPLLELIDLRYSAFNGADSFGALAGIDWVIVGGESGPGARPCNVAWIRSIVEQCREARVPVFVKQLGTAPHADCSGAGPGGWNLEAIGEWPAHAKFWQRLPGDVGQLVQLHNKKGGDMAEFPPDLRVRQFPEVRT